MLGFNMAAVQTLLFTKEKCNWSKYMAISAVTEGAIKCVSYLRAHGFKPPSRYWLSQRAFL
jgi:hypothetical protein